MIFNKLEWALFLLSQLPDWFKYSWNIAKTKFEISCYIYLLEIYLVLAITMAEISILIEDKYFGGDNNIIATFNIN